jgi:hypothetical protein
VTWNAASQTVTIYRNGVAGALALDATTWANVDIGRVFSGNNYTGWGSATFTIGNNPTGTTTGFNGRIDEVSYYPIAISSTDVANHRAVGNASGAPATKQIISVQAPGGTLRTGTLLDDIGSSNFGAINTVSTLPVTNLYDGMTVYFQDSAMALAGLIWTFRYNASSSSLYKWEYMGGPPALARAAGTATRAISSTTYVNVPTDPISYTLPGLAGDWDINVEALAIGTGSLNATLVSYAVGATAATDEWSAHFTIGSAGATVSKHFRHVSVAASAIIQEKARVTGGGAGTIAYRALWITPVRVV